MKYKLLKTLVSISLTSFLTSPAFAQIEEEPAVEAQVRLYTFTNPIRDWSFNSLQGNIPVKIPNALPSAPYFYQGDGQLTFYKNQPTAEGSPTFAPQATTRLRPGVGKYLLLVDKSDTGEKAPFSITSFPGDLSKYPSGSYIIFNGCGRSIAGEIGGERFRVEPGKIDSIKIGKATNKEVTVRLATNTEGEWKMAYSNYWSAPPNARYLIFILDNPKRKDGVLFRTVRDIAL